jgi:hypothetical protein
VGLEVENALRVCEALEETAAARELLLTAVLNMVATSSYTVVDWEERAQSCDLLVQLFTYQQQKRVVASYPFYLAHAEAARELHARWH